MNFLQTLKSSVYNPDFYKGLKKQGLGTAFQYFFILAGILVLINLAFLTYELTIRIPEELRIFLNNTVQSYPKDLVVNIDHGQVTTNAEEPLFVPFPSGTFGNSKNLNNILVIDTKTPYSATQFAQYKTVFWLTKDSLFYESRDYDQRSLDLTKTENLKIDRDFIDKTYKKITPWLSTVGPILMALVLIAMLIGYAFKLIYFLFLGVLIYFLSSIFKWGLSYKTSYITAIYASTLALIADLIIMQTGPYTGFFGFPLLFTLISLCIATINFQGQDKN